MSPRSFERYKRIVIYSIVVVTLFWITNVTLDCAFAVDDLLDECCYSDGNAWHASVPMSLFVVSFIAWLFIGIRYMERLDKSRH